MAMSKDQIMQEAMKLTPAERSALAEELLLSLSDADCDEIDAAWLAEAHRRDEAFQAGEMTAEPLDEVLHQLKGKRLSALKGILASDKGEDMSFAQIRAAIAHKPPSNDL